MAAQPVLEDVVAWIDCELWTEYDGGDHTIVAARVLDLGADPGRRPLLSHRGAYGLLGAPEADPLADPDGDQGYVIPSVR